MYLQFNYVYRVSITSMVLFPLALDMLRYSMKPIINFVCNSRTMMKENITEFSNNNTQSADFIDDEEPIM